MQGWLEVVVGSMFSGKTEELIRRLRRAQLARQKVQVFKPVIDQRYHASDVTSHNKNSIEAIPLNHIQDIWAYLKADTQVVGLDEGQFFSIEVIDIIRELTQRGVRVVVAGLDMDWQGKPFDPMPQLMAIAEEVSKQRAVCIVCGDSASYTQKTQGDSAEQVAVGADEAYEARCRNHFVPRVDQKFSTTDSSCKS